MKRLIIPILSAMAAQTALAVDITAAVREAGAASATIVTGSALTSGSTVFGADKAFDGDYSANGRWVTGLTAAPSGSNPAIIQYDINPVWSPNDLPVAVVVTSFTVCAYCNTSSWSERTPKSFSLLASKTGGAASAEWTELYATKESQTDWSILERRTYQIPSDKQGSYRHYRLKVTANCGSVQTTGFQEIILDGDFLPVSDITEAAREVGAARAWTVKGVEMASYEAPRLFDGNYASAGRWINTTKATADNPVVVQYDLDRDWYPGADVVLSSFDLCCCCNSLQYDTRMPKRFELLASADGSDDSEWVTLFTSDGDSTGWAIDEVRSFAIPAANRGSYRHYRFKVTANNGSNYTSSQELRFHGSLSQPAVERSSVAVFADAQRWYRGADDVNGDGVLQGGGMEYPNALRLALPDDPSHACVPAGPTTNIRIRAENVVAPYRNATMRRSVLHFDQLQWHDAAKDKDVAMIGHLQIPNTRPIDVNGAFTAFFRFKMDSFVKQGNGYNYLANFGFDSDRKNGLLLYLAGTEDKLAPTLAFGGLDERRAFSFDNGLETNKWVDLALAVGDGTVTIYACAEGGCVAKISKDIPAGLGTDAVLTQLTIGGRYATTEPKEWSVANWGNFRGSIAEFATWSRCLTDVEVLEAFGAPRPDLWRLGTPNGTSVEFAGEESTATTVDTDDDFRDVPRRLTADASALTVNFAVSETDAGHPQVLRVVPTPDSGAGRIALSVNGTAVGTADFAPGTPAVIHVAGDLLAEGANALTITRTSGGNLEFDSIAFGGSVQIGHRNGQVFDEFKRTDAKGMPEAYDTAGGNTDEMVQYVRPFGDKVVSNSVIRIHVDPAVAGAGFRHKFVARLRQTGNDPFPVTITLDGVPMVTRQLADGVFTSCSFRVDDLAAGDHLIECVNNGPSGCYFLADCYTLDVVPAVDPGLLIIVK